MSDETIAPEPTTDEEAAARTQEILTRYPKAALVADLIRSESFAEAEAIAKGIHERLSADEQRAVALAAESDRELEEQRRKMDGAFTGFAPDHATRKVWAADVPSVDEHGKHLSDSERMAEFVKRMGVAPPKPKDD